MDATVDEMRALLSGGETPDAGELAGRAQYRATHSAKEAPAFLGDPPSPPPDPSGLPPGAARVMRAMGIAMGEMFGSSEEQTKSQRPARARGEPRRLRGAGAPRDGPRRVRPDREGRRPGDRVDERGLQHPAAPARCDRDRQRRTPVAFGHRRARVRDTRRRGHTRGDERSSPTGPACGWTARAER